MDDLQRKPASIGKWLGREFIAAGPVFLFFLVGFLIILTIVKLALEKFSIEVTVLSSAVVGALVAAKAVLILDETPLARHLENYRRVVAVAVKTSLYGAITLLLGCLERLLEARHRVHSFDVAVHYVIAQASLSRLFAWALAITLVFGVYFALFEISVCWEKESFGTCFSKLQNSQPIAPTAKGFANVFESSRSHNDLVGRSHAWRR